MKPTVWIVGLCVAFAFAASAQSLDDQYVRIYSLIQQGDVLLDSRQPESALAKFTEAETALKRFQTAYPNWNDKVVAFRLRYLAEKIGSIQAQAPAPPPQPAAPTVPTAPAPAVAVPRSTPAQTIDVDRLTEPFAVEIRRLQGERANLEAKLREALGAQPAAADPKELAKANDRIRILQKENEILKVSLAQEKDRSARAADPAVLEQVRSALADSTTKLAQQAGIIASLQKDNQALQVRLQSNPDTAQLRAENQSLKKEVAELRLNTGLTTAAGDLAKQLTDAKTMLTVKNARIETLMQEKGTLEDRLRELNAKPAAPTAPATAATPSITESRALNDKIASLERDLTESRKTAADASSSLEQLQKEKSALVAKVAQYALNSALAPSERPAVAPAKSVPAPAPDAVQISNRLEVLRARLEILEARPVPYTADELVLFKTPETIKSVDPAAARTSSRMLPGGAATLVSQAERAFNERRLGDAEKLYQQAVQMDNRNVYTLANLAAIQLEQARLTEAQDTLTRALVEAPGDAYSLSLMGITKFRLNQFDEALNFLSRAASLEPNNPETQNYLGIALSQKGLRAPAETALRKAVQLSPDYSSAHHNLAVVYATAQPPSIELARFHYYKALAGGHPKNADLEKILNGKGNASN
ncbi:MAG TPA: tetratricopeptide repeat protein [Verrucomicrobiae bacterium]